MKKKKFNKKLSLNKETISNLNEIKGGGDTNPCTATQCWTDCMHTCSPTWCHCTEGCGVVDTRDAKTIPCHQG